jgi:hypothetical protein
MPAKLVCPMKKPLNFPCLLLLTGLLALASLPAGAQTKPAEAKPAEAAVAKPAAPTEKKITFSLKEQKETEYTCVFTKGVNYQLHLNVPDISANKLSLKLFDSQRKELSSKVSNLKTDPNPTLQFNCSTTGLYFLKVTPL